MSESELRDFLAGLRDALRRVEERLTVLEAVPSVLKEQAAARRRGKWYLRTIIFDLALSLVAFTLGATMEVAISRANHAISVSRANACATDVLWLEVIANAPPSATVTKFKSRFEADYAANRCGG